MRDIRPLRSSFAVRPTLWLIGIFLLSLPAVTTRMYASDEVELFSWLRSIVFDHDVSFDNEYRFFYDSGAVHSEGFHETFLELQNDAGLRHNFAPLGCALLWAPFYAGGHLVALAQGARADGFSHPYIAAVAYGSATYGLLAVLLSASIARRISGHGLAASIAVWVGTPLLFYVYVAPVFSHACSAFAVALFLWTWLRVRAHWTVTGVALLGVTGALMAMVRDQDVFFIAGPAMDFARWTVTGGHEAATGRRFRPILARVAAGAAAFCLAYLPQLLGDVALNGHIGPDTAVARKMSWTAPHAWQVLFSPEYGLFAWTPLALLGVAGLVWIGLGRGRPSRADARWLAICALVMVALQVYVSGSVESWTVAGSFGQRRFVSLTPLLAVGLAALLAAVPHPRTLRGTWVPATLVALCVWWNLGLMAQFGLHTMDRQRLTLGQNAWATFVVLPRRGPALVWRYLTDRASFYGQPRQ
jgi:hypothetical protein